MGIRQWGGKRVQGNSERLLRKSPRALELGCALLLAFLAQEFLSEVVFAEWFYHQYHRDYAYTLRSRMEEWIYSLCVTLLASWMLVLAWNLARGFSRRRDRGLFAPRALRAWGVLFALLPLFLLAASANAILHLHMLLWFWAAAVACFELARRRSRAASLETDAPTPFDAGPPPPIE